MKGIFEVFKKGLKKTTTALFRSFETIFSNVDKWDENTYRQLEAALISADLGVPVTQKIIADIKESYQMGDIKTSEDILNIATKRVKSILSDDVRPINENNDGPTVLLMVGVNGAGKTTTTGKLAYKLKQEGKSVMLAACDTFRAAAIEQLKHWGQRIDVPVIAGKHGSDAAAVAFDACASAKAKEVDYLIIDTAGRQHTRQDLMEELPKILRVIRKNFPEAPHETLLVVDGSTGTNALFQAREFGKACEVSGLVVSKLDGSGKGGVVVAIKDEHTFPIHFVGLGESPEDLQPFDPELYADAIFSKDSPIAS